MALTMYAVLALAVAQTTPEARAVSAVDLVIADFEGQTYGDWKSTGEAFGPGPAHGTLRGQMHVDGFKGKGLVNSFFQGDDSTGTLKSPEFRIERKFICFLIGGGKERERLCVNLLIDGKRVRSATGPNDKPGGSETLISGMWDVTELTGKSAIIEIVDEAKGGWGHINVDQIVQTDRRPVGLLVDTERQMKAQKRYFQLPIKNGAAKRKLTILIDGRVEVENDVELADDVPDWWAIVDASAWKGKTITFHVDALAEDSRALSSVDQSDSVKDGQNLYHEPLRGQFHFSSRRGWNNDPNGMVFYAGEYHLFYQHNPYGWAWGNMHWGHAVSKDMIHWQEIGDTLAPDRFGPMFSGSAVVDWRNTSGFGRDGKQPLVLIYTAAGNPTTQCIAYSTDGRNFTKYSGNPVLGQITSGNRDPKVFWHEPTQKWVMVLYVALSNLHTIHFFTSTNLREWTLASVTEAGKTDQSTYLFECPDFFELPIDGDNQREKWVLLAANTEYATGTFPRSDGRRIQIGWFRTDTAGMPFNQSMTIPLELKLISTGDGPRMTWTPVKELNSLRMKSHRFDPMTLKPDSPNPLAGVKAELVELDAEFAPADAGEVTFNVRGATIGYHVKKQELIVNDLRASAPLTGGKQKLTIFCDRTGLEIFASNGLIYVPMPYAPKVDDLSVGVQSKGAPVTFSRLQVHELKSAWSVPVTNSSSSLRNR
jgi:fructan beta-fructosidase